MVIAQNENLDIAPSFPNPQHGPLGYPPAPPIVKAEFDDDEMDDDDDWDDDDDDDDGDDGD